MIRTTVPATELGAEEVVRAYYVEWHMRQRLAPLTKNQVRWPSGCGPAVDMLATPTPLQQRAFDNYGDWVDVGAPESSIYYAVPWGYATWSGTSLATPHDAGVEATVEGFRVNSEK